MTLKDRIPELLNYINSKSALLDFNHVMFNIYEGELLKYVLRDLQKELSPQSYEQVANRAVPINILKKTVDKLATIYQQVPVRQVVDGTDQEKELLAWYEEEMRINYKLNASDEFSNLFNSSLIQPYIYNGQPRIRVIPNDRFLVYSDDSIEPTRPTVIITMHGCISVEGQDVQVYTAYTDDEFVIFNSKEEVDYSSMERHLNVEGINPYGKLPFVYINKSNNLLIPKPDKDGLQVAKLLPILLTDLAGAIKFQAWSIIYGIDVDQTNLKMAANAFWELKSDPNSDKKPEIGTIKPEVDINSVIDFIQATVSLWLNTKGIRPGSIGQLKDESQLSGISKLIDEMDTFEQRKKSVVHFTDAENQLWDLILNYMHPVWVGQRQISNNAFWPVDAKVSITFAEQIPYVKRAELVDTLTKEVLARFMPRSEAIRRLNPTFTDEELEAYMKLIEEESTIIIQDNEPMEDEEDETNEVE